LSRLAPRPPFSEFVNRLGDFNQLLSLIRRRPRLLHFCLRQSTPLWMHLTQILAICDSLLASGGPYFFHILGPRAGAPHRAIEARGALLWMEGCLTLLMETSGDGLADQHYSGKVEPMDRLRGTIERITDHNEDGGEAPICRRRISPSVLRLCWRSRLRWWLTASGRLLRRKKLQGKSRFSPDQRPASRATSSLAVGLKRASGNRSRSSG
jgi:hypothetical protein